MKNDDTKRKIAAAANSIASGLSTMVFYLAHSGDVGANYLDAGRAELESGLAMAIDLMTPEDVT